MFWAGAGRSTEGAGLHCHRGHQRERSFHSQLDRQGCFRRGFRRFGKEIIYCRLMPDLQYLLNKDLLVLLLV